MGGNVSGTRLAEPSRSGPSADLAPHHRCGSVSANSQRHFAVRRTELGTKTDDAPTKTAGDIGCTAGRAGIPQPPCALLRIHGQTAVHNRQTFGLNGIGASRTSGTVQRISIGRFPAHIHISANICRDTGIRTSDTGVITQTNRSWRTSRACEAAIIRRGAVGGKKGGNGDGGHHGNCDCGGGQGAGMREGAGRYHSRSRVMLWRRAPRSASEQSLHHVP